MKHFYQVASFVVNSEYRQRDFRLYRKDWYSYGPGDPVLFAYTSHDHSNGTYHADVNVYRRNFKDKCPYEGKVA